MNTIIYNQNLRLCAVQHKLYSSRIKCAIPTGHCYQLNRCKKYEKVVLAMVSWKEVLAFSRAKMCIQAKFELLVVQF